jgi:hypothetical protein
MKVKDRIPVKEMILAVVSLFNGKTEQEICIALEIRPVVFRRWLEKYGEIGYQYHLIEKDNKRLQRMFTDLSIVNCFLNQAMEELRNKE